MKRIEALRELEKIGLIKSSEVSKDLSDGYSEGNLPDNVFYDGLAYRTFDTVTDSDINTLMLSAVLKEIKRSNYYFKFFFVLTIAGLVLLGAYLLIKFVFYLSAMYI
jgi:hypothetical protein